LWHQNSKEQGQRERGITPLSGTETRKRFRTSFDCTPMIIVSSNSQGCQAVDSRFTVARRMPVWLVLVSVTWLGSGRRRPGTTRKLTWYSRMSLSNSCFMYVQVLAQNHPPAAISGLWGGENSFTVPNGKKPHRSLTTILTPQTGPAQTASPTAGSICGQRPASVLGAPASIAWAGRG
jgi:hypothetical protein